MSKNLITHVLFSALILSSSYLIHAMELTKVQPMTFANITPECLTLCSEGYTFYLYLTGANPGELYAQHVSVTKHADNSETIFRDQYKPAPARALFIQFLGKLKPTDPALAIAARFGFIVEKKEIQSSL